MGHTVQLDGADGFTFRVTRTSAQKRAYLAVDDVKITCRGDLWFPAMNIHPSDGRNFGWGNWPIDGAARGSSPFSGDYVHAAQYARAADYIAIARHDNGVCQASRVWRLAAPGTSLLN